jgi:ribonuclease BN (tRNA processing enzyme)
VGPGVSFAVTILGSSGMFATEERACSGYLVEIDGTRLWMDAGAGTWRNLLAQVDYAELDGVLLSHRHPDHTSDVFQAFHARQYGAREPLATLPLWAPEETIERLCAFGGELEQSFDLHTISARSELTVSTASLTFQEMAHPPETLGIRIEHDGAVLAYSSDTGPGADFHPLAHDADLFICESTLQDSDAPWEGHMRASEAGRIAAANRVGRLVLTHLPPTKDVGVSLAEARANSPGVDVELARDGRRLDGRA